MDKVDSISIFIKNTFKIHKQFYHTTHSGSYNDLTSKFKINLNHGDTWTLSDTGKISVFHCELSVSVVKKQNETLPGFAMKKEASF